MYLSDWMSTSPYSTGYCIQTNFHLTFKATDRICLEHAYIQRNNKQVKCVENPAVLLKFARGITEQTISSFSTYGLKPALILCVCVSNICSLRISSHNSAVRAPYRRLPVALQQCHTCHNWLTTLTAHLTWACWTACGHCHGHAKSCKHESFRDVSAVGLTSTPASNWFSPRRTACGTVEQIQAASLFVSPLGFWFGQSSNSIN